MRITVVYKIFDIVTCDDHCFVPTRKYLAQLNHGACIQMVIIISLLYLRRVNLTKDGTIPSEWNPRLCEWITRVDQLLD